VILLFRRFLAYILVPFFLLLLIGSVVVTCAGWNDNLHAADLAVVLGNKVEPDGQPSPALQARLDHAVDLYRQGYFKLVLVSGAHGKEGYDEPSVMRRYLEANGVPHDAILEDNDGSNTWKTARNSARILNERHLQSVLIISQYFHLPRCRLAFAKFGIQPIYVSPARYWSIRDLYSVPREVIAYVVYSLRAANPRDSSTISD